MLVRDDTLTAPEQALAKALAPKSQDVYVTLYDYSLELARTAQKSFTVQPAWRDELFRRVAAKGVKVDRAVYDAAPRYIDRLLEQRVAQLTGGDSTAKRHDLRFDAPLRKTLELMEKGSSQKDLFTLAATLQQDKESRPASADLSAGKPPAP